MVGFVCLRNDCVYVAATRVGIAAHIDTHEYNCVSMRACHHNCPTDNSPLVSTRTTSPAAVDDALLTACDATLIYVACGKTSCMASFSSVVGERSLISFGLSHQSILRSWCWWWTVKSSMTPFSNDVVLVRLLINRDTCLWRRSCVHRPHIITASLCYHMCREYNTYICPYVYIYIYIYIYCLRTP